MVNLLQPGVDFPVTLETAVADVSSVSTGTFSLAEFITHVFPTSIADAMVEERNPTDRGDLAVHGHRPAVARLRRPRKVTELMEQVAFLMLKITGYVMMAAAPFAVFGAIAYTVSLQGLGVIVDYSRLVGTFFLALFILWAAAHRGGLS
jgi:Na+/H+-dicarboxylate symporter